MKPYYETKLGRLYHGDCLEIMPMLKKQSTTLLFADPPYGHDNHVNDLNARLNKFRKIENKPIQNDSPEKMRILIDLMLRKAIPLLKPDRCCCCCCCCGGGGPRPTFAWLAKRMDKDGLEFFHSVIWDKKNPGLGWRFRRRHEMLMFSHLKGGRLSWNEKDFAISNLITAYPPRKRKHPNEKPTALYTVVINSTTNQDDLVLDPFFGSGTTAVVCEDLNRRWIGIEIEEKYCKIAKDRIERELQQKKLPGF